jgi:putative protease
MSSLQSGNSGNRGRCSQPCRDEYLTPNGENNFPLNLKDNSAWFNLQELADAGVDSIKIEGRIKKFHYVYSVVTAYKQQLQNVYNKVTKSNDNSVLYKVFNRDFSNAFLKGDINKNMFINNPRDNSSTHLAKQNGGASTENIDKAEMALYAEKGQMREFIKHKIDQLNAEKAPVVITVSGKVDSPLHLHVKAPETSFVLHSEINLVNKGIMPVDEKMLLKRLKAINETEYFIKEIDLTNIEGEIFIPFSELTALKNRILYPLKNSKETLAPVALPVLTKANKLKLKPNLAILIDSEKDIALSNKTKAIFYFQLPSHFVNKSVELIQLFTKNKNIIPWFPSVLIGENYSAALDFLKQVQPKLIVANNTGIAYESNKMGIEWIAGPFLNSTNSYALKCLKEELNCAGAFISNELNKEQIQRIKKPDDFNLYFSIYHPIVLMSSRQCLFHTTVGCKKNTMDESCMPFCSKATSITNLKKETFFIHKSQGNYNTVYNEKNYLNTKIITDIPNRFSGFLIDLRDIKTTTKTKVDKAQLISLFEHHIANNPDSEKDIHQSITQTTSIQYVNGI